MWKKVADADKKPEIYIPHTEVEIPAFNGQINLFDLKNIENKEENKIEYKYKVVTKVKKSKVTTGQLMFDF